VFAGAIALLWLQAFALGQGQAVNNWQSLDARAADLYAGGDLPQAIAAAEEALRAAASPRESGKSLDRLGFLLYTSGKLPEGEKYLRESLRVREDAFGADSLDYAETANDLAQLLRDLRRMDESKALAERSVTNRIRALGADDLLVAESLNTQGSVHALAGDYVVAVSMFERAMAIHERRPPLERANEEYGTLCVNAAGTYQRLGKYEVAERSFEKGIEALRVKPGVDHPAYAASVLAYAALKVDLGRYLDAERMYDEGGRLVAKELGAEHPVYATFLNNRGALFQAIGNVEAAQTDYRRSLELKRKLYGPGSLLAASTLRNLAHLAYSRDRTAGERLLAEAVDVYTRLTNPPPFDYVSVLLGLGRAQLDRGATSDARVTIQKGLSVAREGLGTRHPLYAAAVRDTGLVLSAIGDAAGAERNLREAVGLAEDVHGSDHPDLTAFVDALAGFYARQGNDDAALQLYRRSFEIQDRFLSDILQIGSENFKASSMATTVDPIPTLIAFQASAGARVPAARALAFEAVTRRKGRVLEQVRNWRQRLRENAAPATIRQLAAWEAMLECRTSLTVALGYREIRPSVVGGCGLAGTDLEGRYEKLLSDLRVRRTDDVAAEAVRAIRVLKDRGDEIEAALNRDNAWMGVAPTRVSVDEIRRQTGTDELLLEYVSYQDSRAGGTGGRRYGAFVLDSDGTVGWSEIGPAGPIDSSVSDLLEAANDWSASVRNRESQSARSAVTTARDALRDLSTRVWAPLEPILQGKPNVRRLRIAPDASLNLVPFEALSDGRDLIERYAITYVPAGRDVTTEQPANPASAAPLVVVSPGASAVKASTREAPSGTFRAAGLARLSAADAEAADLRRAVPHAQLYSASDATERRVKSVHGPSLLHIVGHGVIRGDDVMGLSAIVLEEAYGRGRGSSDDGMLTASELQNVDLRGTEMLVLSQCQMANGVASVGEGVYGMRRAAAIAGARSFVAPLWNVDDRVQRTLMAQFYNGLAMGLTRSEALRRAKLRLRASPATSSFLYWAPVILSGSASALPPALFRQ
jgi:CHAT domain-containing protein/tetratricopeptide (TPR) repeat protein